MFGSAHRRLACALLACLMLALLPLRGWAHTVMHVPGGAPASAAPATAMPCHAAADDVSAMAHAPVHATVHDAPHGVGADGAASDDRPSSQACALCALCHGAAVTAPMAPDLALPAPAGGRLAADAEGRLAAPAPDGPFRPPRA